MICVAMPNFATQPPSATILYLRCAATSWACVHIELDSELANVIKWHPLDSLTTNKSQMTLGIGAEGTESPQQLTNRDRCLPAGKWSTTEQMRSLVSWWLMKDRKWRGCGSFIDFSTSQCIYVFKNLIRNIKTSNSWVQLLMNCFKLTVLQNTNESLVHDLKTGSLKR